MDRDVSLFGGAAGRVLWGAVSVHSLIAGLAMGLLLFVNNMVLLYAGAHVLVTPFTQVVVALALARFVLNGQYGEWRGSLLSAVGGSWATVGLVASRYLLLTSIWLVPMMLFGLRIEQAAMPPALLGERGFVLFTLYGVASALTPPLFLIVSVTAHDLGELFSPEHWRRTFGGRLIDLLSIYAVYAGGVAMAILLSLPVVMLGFLPSWKLGAFLAGLAVCFVLGLAVNLLGRLCGFYALGDFTCPAESEPTPALLSDPGVAPAAGDAGLPAAAGVHAPADPGREPVPVSQVDEPRAPAPAPQPSTASASAVPANASPSAPVPAAPVAEAAQGQAVPVLPALLDASQRIDPILRRFQQDPAGAIGALEDLRQAFAPHPQVLVALCLCRHRNGDVDGAVGLAQTVLPLCFERGHVQLAAQVFKQLRREVDRLGLNREQILIVGEVLTKKGDLAGAGAAYSIAIGRDPGEMRAVKGLLHIAGVYANQRAKPEAALKVYDYLLKHCAGSPLAEFMREGRVKCQKILAQPVG